MAETNEEKRFLFTGKAVAFGGRIRRDQDLFIEGVASSCLPVTGGKSTGVSKSRKYHDGAIQFTSATSEVHGDYHTPARAIGYTKGNYGQNDLPTATSSTCTLSGLKVSVPGEKAKDGKTGPKRTFEAQELVAALKTTCDRGKKETKVVVSKPVFEGIKVNGVALNVTPKAGKSLQEAAAESDGPVVRSVVQKLSFAGKEKPAGVEIQNGNVLKIDGLGTIHFGEIFVKGQLRRLTLLRFQLGSPIGGELAAADCFVEGSSIPP